MNCTLLLKSTYYTKNYRSNIKFQEFSRSFLGLQYSRSFPGFPDEWEPWVYMEYRKAFDTVPHQRLLTKLKGFGLGVGLMKWIGSLLSNRLMRVMVNGQYSSWSVVVSGVPQGSILGPLLFLLFVNDIPDWIITNITMFADDTKIWTQLSCPEDAVKLQQDLDMLSDWSAKWLLKFNPLKCKFMHLWQNMDMKYYITQDNQKWNIQSVQQEKGQR